MAGDGSNSIKRWRQWRRGETAGVLFARAAGCGGSPPAIPLGGVSGGVKDGGAVGWLSVHAACLQPFVIVAKALIENVALKAAFCGRCAVRIARCCTHGLIQPPCGQATSGISAMAEAPSSGTSGSYCLLIHLLLRPIIYCGESLTTIIIIVSPAG